jgi:Fe-S-cluster containining protein
MTVQKMINLKLDNVDFPDGISFKCKNCGKCCRYIPGDVNSQEEQRIQLRGFENFLGAPTVNGNKFFKRKKDGRCFFLTNDNKCEIYDIRPMVCRLEPFGVTDWDYNQDVIYVQPRLDIICPGIVPGSEEPSLDIAKAAQDFVKETRVFIARTLNLPISGKETLHEVREYIIRQHFPL